MSTKFNTKEWQLVNSTHHLLITESMPSQYTSSGPALPSRCWWDYLMSRKDLTQVPTFEIWNTRLYIVLGLSSRNTSQMDVHHAIWRMCPVNPYRLHLVQPWHSSSTPTVSSPTTGIWIWIKYLAVKVQRVSKKVTAVPAVYVQLIPFRAWGFRVVKVSVTFNVATPSHSLIILTPGLADRILTIILGGQPCWAVKTNNVHWRLYISWNDRNGAWRKTYIYMNSHFQPPSGRQRLIHCHRLQSVSKHDNHTCISTPNFDPGTTGEGRAVVLCGWYESPWACSTL